MSGEGPLESQQTPDELASDRKGGEGGAEIWGWGWGWGRRSMDPKPGGERKILRPHTRTGGKTITSSH